MVDVRQLTAAVFIALLVTFMASFGFFSDQSAWGIVRSIVPLACASLYALLPGRQAQHDRTRTALVWIALLFCILPVMTVQIAARQGNGPATHIHDGAVQTEAASQFFRHGINPYAADFRTTAFGAFIDQFSNGTRANPAYTHYVYLPATFLLVAPVQAVTEAALGWFDVRLLYFLGWLALLGVLTWRVASPWRDLCLVLVALNPFIQKFLFNGVNDFMVLLFLTGAALLLERRRVTWAGLVFALAVASKQSAWIILPFFLLAVIQASQSKSWWRALQPLWPGALLCLGLIGSFAVWSWSNFISDVWSYANGSTALSYPASGLGLGQWLVSLGILRSPFDPFPFWIFMLVIGLPAVGFALFRQWQDRGRTNFLWFSVWGLLAVWIVARYFNDTHPGFLIALFTVSAFLRRSEPYAGIGASAET